MRTSKKQGDLLPQDEFQRKSGFDSHHDDIETFDFSNVVKLAGEAAKYAATMELDSETNSGESETSEDDDDTNEEGPGICFETSILVVVAVLLFVVCWMMNLEMAYMKSGCTDIKSGDTRYYVWYVQFH